MKDKQIILTDNSIITLVEWNKELFEKCIKYQEEISNLKKEIARLKSQLNLL